VAGNGRSASSLVEHADSVSAGGTQSLRNSINESRRLAVVDDIWEDRRTRHAKDSGIPRLSLLAVPMSSHGDIIGILYVAKEANQGFDQDDLDVMTGFADHATIAIENARLIAKSLERERLQQELLVARHMQKRLLPQRMPSFPQVEFAAVSESSAEVGGDYYDFFDLGNDKIGIVVADVSGKGVSAAFYMAELKGIFLSLMRLSDSPKQVLIQANRALLESLEKNAFISVVYGILDVSSGEFVVSRAGHCPLVWTSKTGVELVRPNGLGLGLTQGAIFEQATEERMLKLKLGDSCLLYTDGVTEARNREGDEFGYERLVEAMTKLQGKDAEDIKTGILDEIRTFSGNSAYTDDMTLVVVKWRA
jgi:sigma-B regulation protein RsbU (phosphoserine phosphatase)